MSFDQLIEIVNKLRSNFRFSIFDFRFPIFDNSTLPFKKKSSKIVRRKSYVENRISHIAILFCLFVSLTIQAQFAPPAGQAGSTAISKDSSIIIGWATACTIQRGLRQINLPDSGYAAVGDSNSVIGMAGLNGVVSLGDGGIATLQFATPISDGSGFDFCVFENGFQDDFLEMAFVDVSSDGLRFVRFPATSLTEDSLQTASFGLTDATKLNNLAGKYRAGYGAPFDLLELRDSAGLDIHNITHVRIVDVVGTLDSTYASRDSHGKKVNDPWPTNFPSGGFDLDAVGVMRHYPSGISENAFSKEIHCYPNPFSDFLFLENIGAIEEISVYDVLGRLELKISNQNETAKINTQALASGVHSVLLKTANGQILQRSFIRR